MPEHDAELVGDDMAAEDSVADRLVDRFKGAGVGTEDPTIIGDAGPTDVPPGTDGDALRLATSDEPVDHLEV